MNTDRINFLESYLTPHRKHIIETNLSLRTRYVTFLLEDIFQSQNASAVLRTADCCGIQDIHVVENRNAYTINPTVVRGANQWINLHRYNQTEEAIINLKNQGYRIIATVPTENATSLPNFDLTKGKCAFAFGTERTGLSKFVIENADEFVTIPMMGFTESYNISVSAAIIAYTLTQQLRLSNLNWQLNESEKSEIKLEWLRFSVRKPELLEKHFEQNIIKQK